MKICVTARDFSTGGDSAVRMLREAGHEVVDLSACDMGSATSPQQVWEAVGDAQIAITGMEPYNEDVFAHCPRLQMISRRGIGYDSVELEACRRRGITLARTVGAVEGSVAEHVLACILYFARRLDLQNASMHRGEWRRVMTPGAKTRKLGLVGFGGIGREIALRARPLGMEIFYYCRHPRAEWENEYGAAYLELDELLAACDYVSVNVPLDDSTRGMFGAGRLARMKEGSILINIARGPVVDAHALREALDSGHLAGAAVDVFDREPCTDSPLVGCPNALLTPHTATYTSENFNTMNDIAARSVLAYLAGTLEEKYIVR